MRKRTAFLLALLMWIQPFLVPTAALAASSPAGPTPAEDAPPWAGSAPTTMATSGYYGYSGLNPYTLFSSQPADEVFIADQGGKLDQYLCRSASPITFNIDINRVYGAIAKLSGQETWNNLQNPAAMVAAGVIAPYATLYMRVYDIDHDYQGSDYAPEVDQVSVNGHKLTRTLTSGNNKWDTVSFQVPIDYFFYPDMAPIGGKPANAPNEIRVDVDTANSGWDVWCAEVDWAAVQIHAARPAVLVNGILSNDHNAWDNFRPFLWQKGLPNYAQEVDATRGIFHNASDLAAAMPGIKSAFGVDRINIIAHSKGGLDSRAYLREHDDVDTLVQLATPNRGSDCAQSWVTNLLGSTWDLDPDWIFRNFNYKDTRKHFWNEHNYVPAWTEFGKAPIYIFAGTKLTDRSCPVGIGDPMDPPHDSVVSHDRATLPWNWNGVDGDGIDQGITNRVGPYDHSSIHDSQPVADQAVAWIAATYGLGGGGGSPYGAESTFTAATAAAQPQPAATSASSERFVEQTGARLSAGQTARHSFLLDSTTQAQVAVIHGSAATSVRLLGPDSAAIAPSATGRPVGVNLADVFNLTAPKTGTYVVEVTTAAPSDLYELQVRTVSGPRLTAALEAESVAPGASTVLTASFTDAAGGPIAGAQVTVDLLGPDGSRQSVAMADQGGGKYTAPVSSSVGGITVALVRAVKDGTQRSASALLAVVPASATLTGTVTEGTADTNADGLFDKLNLAVGVNAAQAGQYVVSGDLYDGSGRLISQASASATLAAGSQTMALSFSGDKLYAAGAAGPYLLKNVVLTDASHDGLPVDALESPYTTRAYSLSQFQHRPVQVTGGSDQGVDSNGDGKFDWLKTNLTIKADVAGNYRASARLVTAAGEELDWASSTVYIGSGTGTIPLWFNGQKIRSGGANGRYKVIDLMIEGPRVGVQPVAYQTGVYDFHQFQPIGADLVVLPERITTAPASPAPGQATTLTAVVENRGAAITGTFQAEFYLGNPAQGGSIIGRAAITGMAAESEQAVSVPWTVPAASGAYEVYVVLNRTRSVPEFDYSNNTSFQVFTVSGRDSIPPVTTATENPAPNAAGWHNASFTVTLAATDDLSGVAATEYRLDGGAWQPYTGPLTFEAEGLHTLGYRSTDGAGNMEAEKQLTLRLDLTPPTVKIGGVTPGQVSLLVPITPVVKAADNLDPSPAASVTLNGEPYTSGTMVSAYGQYELAVTATDAAGNQTHTRLGFMVADRPMYAAYLRTRVNDLAAQVKQDYSGTNLQGLLAKLQEASDRLTKAEDDLKAGRNSADGNLTAAGNVLEAFDHLVRTLDLKEEQRQSWLDQTQSIRDGIALLLKPDTF